MIVCKFCEKPVNPNDPYLAEFVSGWVERRRGGGAHGVRLMSLPSALAHAYCLDGEVERLKKQEPKGQGALL